MSDDFEIPDGLIVRAPREGLYIDPVLLLQYLDNHGTVYAEKIATPGLDPLKTELLRGCRTYPLSLRDKLTKELENAT